MIARSHFTRIADAQQVNAKTVERDYVLTHVLAAICQQPGSRRMVFKGGTALRLCYFEDYRYSADLDFSLTESMTTEQALDLVGAALLALTDDRGFADLGLSEDGKYITYIGPLGGQRQGVRQHRQGGRGPQCHVTTTLEGMTMGSPTTEVPSAPAGRTRIGCSCHPVQG